MQMGILKGTTLLGTALVLLVTVDSAQSADYSGKVSAGVGISDNIGRSTQAEIDETIATAGFEFGAASRTRTADFSLRASFDYLDYLDDTFDSEWVGGLDGNVTFSLVEERLRWIVQDNYGQQLSDTFQPATPGNRENVNYFSTGPSIYLLPPGRNSLVVDARYNRVDYEDRPADNDRLSGTISLGRSLSPDRDISANFSVRRTEYDDSGLVPPWEGHDAFVRYATKGSRNTLSIDAGFNEVEYAGRKSDGLLLNVSWTRTTSANGSLQVSGGSRYSDQGDLFRLLQSTSLVPGDTSDISQSRAPFLNNYLRLGYSLRQQQYSINANLGLNQEDLKDGSGLDRDLFSGDLNLRRDLSRKIFASARVRLQRREFKYEDRRDDDLTLGVETGYRIGAGLDASLEYQHFQRNSTTAGADFTENRAFLRLSYTPMWSRQTGR